MSKKDAHKRQAIRLNASKECTKAEEILDDNAQPTIEHCKTTITKLNDYRSRLQLLDDSILDKIEDDEAAAAEASNASDVDESLLDKITKLSSKLETIQTTSADQNISLHHGGSIQSLSDHRIPAVNLPKLHLAKFGGDPLKWAEFWDSFSTTIHDNDGISDVDKFKYLRSYLVGDALRLVDGYRLTSENYTAAVEVLTERFGNKQIAAFAHLEAMIELPAVNHDIQQLQKIYDDCEKHIRSLVALGLKEETFGLVFTPIILSKLPPFVKMELHRKNGSNPWELSNLRQWLREEIRARDYSQRTFGGTNSSYSPKYREERSNNKTPNKPHFHRASPNQATSSALLTNDGSPKTRCSFCGESHFTEQCKKYPDIKSRRAQLNGRCLICLSTRHSVKDCKNPRPCAHCNKTNHHRSLCMTKFGSNSGYKSTSASHSLNISDTPTSNFPQLNTTLLSHGERVILQTALAQVEGSSRGKPAEARILFDTGCSRSFITTALAHKIAARSLGTEVVSMAGFGDDKRKTRTYNTVEIDVVLDNGKRKTLTVNVIPNISCPIQKVPLDVQQSPFIKQMKLAEPLISSPQLVAIDILLGTDYYYEFIGCERLECPNGIIFLSSTLGFIATGKVKCEAAGNTNATTLLFSKMDPDPDSLIHIDRFWSLEEIGVKSPITTNDDEDALENFNRTTRFEDGRYQVTFPFKKDAPELPDNKRLAAGRISSLIKRIGADEKIVAQYDKTIQDQLQKGIIEEAPEIPTSNRVHYIPHHCVLTPGKATTKLRIVYDASAKASKTSPSLNECLNRGPVMLDDLCGLLLRFRTHPIALVSDIEKAFLQVGLDESSRDVTRFFWLKDLTKPPSGNNLITFRFCRVPFGTMPSPFLLAATVNHHLHKSNSPAAETIKGNVYVDNVITGKESIEASVTFYKQSKTLFDEATMNLREWFTNSNDVLEQIKPEDRGQGTKTRILGMAWDTESDVLHCSSFDVERDAVTTKRLMLKYLAKVFDPYGLFSAVTIAGKLLIQKLWKMKYCWDDQLPEDIIKEWNNCAESLQQIPRCGISRWVGINISDESTNRQLHCFCDASGKAYAAVIYLLVKADGVTKSDLIFAKARVGPIKDLSIPRMELMAALIGVRLLAFVEKELRISINDKFVWSDSQCVLHWLVKESITTTFVKNRVKEINSHHDVKFRYVPTAVNPADLSSRGCTLESISDNRLWWNGPTWLTSNINEWPQNVELSSKTAVVNSEENTEASTMVAVADEENDAGNESVLKATNFSSLQRLLRVTSWVRRFITNATKQTHRNGTLSIEELSESQEFWEKRIQKKHFGNILKESQDNKSKMLIKQLDLFIDPMGIIRCGGRLEMADVPEDAKHPKLLPKNEWVTALVIRDCHQRLFHSGVAHTLSQIRYKYWIVHGRGEVKRIIKSCRLCRILRGGTFPAPKPPPLPDFRVKQRSPFSCTGIDYMGPMFVKSLETNEVSKVWICLFTCGVIRAIHLEVVESLSSQSFLLALRRFMALYGKPQIIVSDNAKHFHSSNKFLVKAWRELRESDEIQEFATVEGIKWKFITELAPWMGGFYERMIGVTKNALRSSLNKRCISLVELQTLSSEISAIINSRPLVYPEADISAPPLTPSHFLGGSRSCLPSFVVAIDDFGPTPTTEQTLLRDWRKSQIVLNNFWNMWQGQYLLSLRKNNINFGGRNHSEIKPTIGTTVIVKGSNGKLVKLLNYTPVTTVCAGQQQSSSQIRKT